MKRAKWTITELEWLQRQYHLVTDCDLLKNCAPHPIGSIHQKAGELGLSRRRCKRQSPHHVIRQLRRIREIKKMDRIVLSEALGYHLTMLGRWERGDSTPSLQRLQDWACALNYRIGIVPL